jgi:hypothetical protein
MAIPTDLSQRLDYQMNDREIVLDFWQVARNVSLLQHVHPLGFNQPHSVPVRNVWVYTSTIPYTFMVWCLTKCRDKFNFCCMWGSIHFGSV